MNLPMKSHLGIYSDWIEASTQLADLYPVASPGEETRQKIRRILGFNHSTPVAQDVQIESTWERDGLLGEEISWSVRYGPRTQAWLLKPRGSDAALPGIVALHGHANEKRQPIAFATCD